MSEISNYNHNEEFEILNDENINLNLKEENPNIITNDIENKIKEEDYNKLNNYNKYIEDNESNFIINNNNNNKINDKNIIDDMNISETFKKIIKKEEKKEEIFDFENIEIKEEEKGDFTEITISSLSLDKKEEKEENKIQDKNEVLYNIYQNLNFGNNYNINNNLFSDKLSKTCINLSFKNNKLLKNSSNIIQIMSVLKPQKINSWKDNFKSLVSSLYYNGYALSKKFDRENPDIPLYIFDTKIENVIKVEIKFLLRTFLYMSYRSGLVNLKSIGGGDYTSDCGWGCMIRCCQMMLSKGLIQKKMNDFYKKYNSPLNFKTLESIRKETLYLFNDNYLKIKEVKNHPDFNHYWELYKSLTKINPEYKSISEVVPPYSIHILCKLGNISGQYTSDIKIIKLFSKINSELFPDFNILCFECGLISKFKLISSFCEEYIESNTQNSNYLDTITFNGKDYIFKKSGIVFISFRLGLSELDPNYYNIIPLLFTKFRNNIGFVSGKKNKAYYFVGIDKNSNLIFFDPHYNQLINNDIDKDYKTYFTENIYLLDVKNLSSELTLGIGIFNIVQFTQFLEDLQWFHENFKDIGVISLCKDFY